MEDRRDRRRSRPSLEGTAVFADERTMFSMARPGILSASSAAEGGRALMAAPHPDHPPGPCCRRFIMETGCRRHRSRRILRNDIPKNETVRINLRIRGSRARRAPNGRGSFVQYTSTTDKARPKMTGNPSVLPRLNRGRLRSYQQARAAWFQTRQRNSGKIIIDAALARCSASNR